MRVNELKTFDWSVAFTGDDGSAAIPTTAEWRLVCLETNNVLQDWTALTVTTTYAPSGDPESSTATVTVPASAHEMQTAGKAVERKALCVAANRGLSTEWNTELQYEVVRLRARS